MYCVRVEGTDPSHNLALEEAFFTHMPRGESWFLLWQNGPSVIVGRHQNALEEVNMQEVRLRGLPVVRRSTGGGAVYHDLGNLNFSFLEDRPDCTGIDFARYLDPVVRALARLGVAAVMTGRNDLEVAGRKISGSAQRLHDGRVLHHGTLLVDANFEDMTRALNPDPEKYLSHGVASVRSRVANISEFWQEGSSLDALCAALVRETGAEAAALPGGILAQARRLVEEKYGRWEWNIGKSPRFTFRNSRHFPWGRVDLRLVVDRGVVRQCRIYGDFFAAKDISLLESALTGTLCRRDDLLCRLRGYDLRQWFSGCSEDEMRAFLTSV